MKKLVRRFLLLLVIFILGVTGTALLLNNETTDDRSDMNNATLPEVMVEFDGVLANRMYGYREPMQVDFTRDSITPVDTTKKLTLVVNPYGTKVKSLSYEVRTSDGSKVIENKKISDLKEEDGFIRTTIELVSDLLMSQEYSLQITLDTDKGEAHYYTRVISRPNLNTGSYVSFVKSFYEKCMDKGTAEELASYLEPAESAVSTNFNNISIHSTLRQVSWDNLAPRIYRKGIPVIKDINETTSSVSLEYQILTKDGKGVEQIYDVEEFYRMRFTETRIRLLDFQRSASQVFHPESLSATQDGLLLGVRDRDITYMTSDEGNIVVFCQQGDLWSYAPETGKTVRIFSFRKDEEGDFRDARQEHNIKIIRVGDNGDVDFVLYGYMNRGNHEGYCGVSVYHYNSDQNVLEEKVFIPSTESYEFLEADLGTLSYVSSKNELFLLFAEKLYLVDINEGTSEVLDEGIQKDNFVVSDTNAHAAWLVQEGEDAGKIKEISFDTLEERLLVPEAGQQLRTLGFMNEDLVYGVLMDTDILTDGGGRIAEGIHTLRIEGFDGTVKKEYHQEGLYITDVSINGTLMEFDLSKKAGKSYTFVKKDNVMNNRKAASKQVAIEQAYDEKAGIGVRLAFEEAPATDNLLIVLAKLRNVEEREILLDTRVSEENVYYVYGQGGLDSIHTNAADAIMRADSCLGVVLNRAQQYVWERGNQKTEIQINKEDIPEIMRTGSWDRNVLQKGFGDSATVIDLSGCSLESILYFVSAQRPVVAKTGENVSVVIVGYDEYNTYLYDPRTGEIYPYGMNDSKTVFGAAGNVFMSYVENVSY